MKYNDKLCTELQEVCDKYKCNKKWYWLIIVEGTREKGRMYITESGEKHNYHDFNGNFEETCEEFAKVMQKSFAKYN